MVMEMRSDKIIQDKINSVNDLPEGYSPNLNSKWELLQAGLKSEQNKKSVMYYIQRASVVAAMLLLIGGSGLLIIKKPTKPITSSLQTNNNSVVNTATKIEEVHQLDEKKVSKPSIENTKKVMVNAPSQLSVNNQNISVDTITQKVEVVNQTIVNTTNNKQVTITERFTEIDFTTPVLAPSAPTDVLVKAQKFKFKLGVGNNFQVNNHAGFTPVIKIKTGF
jgi:hypothetical protein